MPSTVRQSIFITSLSVGACSNCFATTWTRHHWFQFVVPSRSSWSVRLPGDRRRRDRSPGGGHDSADYRTPWGKELRRWMVGRSVSSSQIQCLLASLPRRGRFNFRIKTPHLLLPHFAGHSMPGKPEGISYGVVANIRTSCRFRDLCPPRSPPPSVRLSLKIPRVRFGTLTWYPFDPRIQNLKRSRQICFVYCRTLISRTGVDKSGKKGIFPSNYVRLTNPGGTRPGRQNWLTHSIYLAFRSCWHDGREPSTPVPYYLTWRMINCDILAP